LPRVPLRTILLRLTAAMVAAGVPGQAVVVARVKPQDLVTGVGGMADILHRAFPPDVQHLPQAINGVIETLDIAILRTVAGIVLSLPLAVCAAENLTPSRGVYLAAGASSRSHARCPTWCGHCCLSPVPIVIHAIMHGLLPSLLGISLYRLDENVRSSLVLGLVGAGGSGFLILTAMNLFQEREACFADTAGAHQCHQRAGFDE
jgi:phosphonate transport system permease protein